MKSVLAASAALCLAVNLLACAESGTDGTTVELQAHVLPIGNQVETVIGYSTDDLARVLDAARADQAVECARARGYSIARESLPDLDDQVPDSPIIGGAADSAERRIEAADLRRDDEQVDPTTSRALGECLAEAETEISNPLESLNSWLSEEEGDLTNRVMSDDHYQKAQVAYDNCLAAAGVSQEELSAQQAENFEAGSAIVDRFIRGDTSRAAADAEVATLRKAEAGLVAVAEPCLSARLDVERSVRIEVEADWLQDNAATLSQLAEDAREAVNKEFAAYLQRLSGH